MRLRKPLCCLFFLSLPGLSGAQAPAAPSGVVAYSPSGNRAHLSWVDNATDETAYWVDRFEGGAWVVAATLPADFELVRLNTPGLATQAQSIRYRVAAVKGGVPSDWVEATVEKPEGSLSLATNLEGSEARVGVRRDR